MNGRVVLALFGVQAAALWTMAWGDVGTPYPTLVLWAIAFAAYLLAAGMGAEIDARKIWAGGILLRLGVLPAAPSLSEDIYRYIWDGWVQRGGVNPYLHAPGATELEPLRTDWWALINHPEVPTIYPPGAQLVFLALAWIGPFWWVFKLAWLAADLGLAAVIGRLVSGGTRLPLLLYLWSPLVVIEVAWSGHLDPVGVLPMMAALLFVGASAQGTSGAALRGGALLGLGASIKFAPLVAVPVLWRRHGWVPVLVACAIPLGLYVVYVSAGSALFGGLRTYADIWEFNAGIYNVLERLPGPRDVPKWIAGAVVAAILVQAVRRRWTLERTLFWAVGAALLMSPTIHPWYLLWVLPLACLRVSRGWILLTGTVFFAYAGRDTYLMTGVWPEPAWASWAIHGIPLALLVWDGWRSSAKRLAGGDQVAEREEAGEGDRAR